jgi:hypothetical protein
MADRIEPALSAEEWERQYAIRPERLAVWLISFDREFPGLHIPVTSRAALTAQDPRALTAIIAAANAALPENDQHRITAEMVSALGDLAESLRERTGRSGPSPDVTPDDTAALTAVETIARTLASYLPPEGA